jgi:heme oxygenase
MRMAALRAATASQHACLERDLNLLRDDLSPGHYCTLLERFYGYYDPWERNAAALLGSPEPPFFASRRKTPLLREDLRFWGRSDRVLADLPRCTDLPVLHTLPGLLGSMYVLEGATLGGQLLARQFERTLGLRDGHGYAFFRSYGSEVGRRWREFGAVVEDFASPGAEPEMTRAAQQTFATLHRWLCAREGV